MAGKLFDKPVGGKSDPVRGSSLASLLAYTTLIIADCYMDFNPLKDRDVNWLHFAIQV